MRTRQKVRRVVAVVSTALFPVTLYYFSPFLSIEGLSSGIVTGSLVLFALLFLASLFLGRAFCAWVCPAGALQEIVLGFRGRAVKRTRVNWIKWLVWSPWVLALVFVVFRSGGVRTVNLTWRTWHGISVSDPHSLVILAVVAALFAGLALAVGRRAGCHTVCWMAPFMVLGGRLQAFFGWPALRIAAKAGACQDCGACSRACPMSIEVAALAKSGHVESTDCILCASCADGCPHGALRLTFRSGH